MNLFLHSVSSLSNLTFSSLKERTGPPITPRQKIITIIALAAFACLTLGYVLYQYVSRKKDIELKKGEVQKVNHPEEEKLKANWEKEQIQLEPEKNKVRAEKKDDAQHIENLEEEKLGGDNGPKVEEQIENEHKSLIRSVYLTFLGIIDESKWLTEPQIELLSKKLKKWIAKSYYQENKYKNDNPSLFFLDYEDFGMENKIDEIQLKMFIRYLILKEEVFAYNEEDKGFCIYLNKESYDNRAQIDSDCYTTQKLKEAEQLVESLDFPPLDDYTKEERLLAENVINDIKRYYYRRASGNHVKNKNGNFLISSFNFPNVSKFMDQLVMQRVIHSWNCFEKNEKISIKFKEEDLIQENPSSFKFKIWRDQQAIEREIQFCKENSVNITE